MSQLHIRVLLGQMDLGPADLDVLAVQLSAALDGPLLLTCPPTPSPNPPPGPPNASPAAGRPDPPRLPP